MIVDSLLRLRANDSDVATYQEAVILPPLAVGAYPIPLFLNIVRLIRASHFLIRVASSLPFTPPSSGSDFAVTTSRQSEVPICCPPLTYPLRSFLLSTEFAVIHV